MRSLRPASCWKVEVMNGAAGRLRYGLRSTLRTRNSVSFSPSASVRAALSSRWTVFGRLSSPAWVKLEPAATGLPSRVPSPAVKSRGASASTGVVTPNVAVRLQ